MYLPLFIKNTLKHLWLKYLRKMTCLLKLLFIFFCYWAWKAVSTLTRSQNSLLLPSTKKQKAKLHKNYLRFENLWTTHKNYGKHGKVVLNSCVLHPNIKGAAKSQQKTVFLSATHTHTHTHTQKGEIANNILSDYF